MSKYAGTKTEANLRAAFAGESQARNQYTFFASVAKKEGYEQMAALFLKTAENEKEHAKLWLKELAGIGDTKANLAAAAAGENYEWTDMYQDFAKTAEETASPDSDPEQAALAFICKQLKLNLKKLSEEEKKWLKKIAQKSDLLKNPTPQRGRK